MLPAILIAGFFAEANNEVIFPDTKYSPATAVVEKIPHKIITPIQMNFNFINLTIYYLCNSTPRQ